MISKKPLAPTYDSPKWLKMFSKISKIGLIICVSITFGLLIICVLNYISFGHWDWGLEKYIDILKNLMRR